LCISTSAQYNSRFFKYAGLVPEIGAVLDPSGRTDLLKILDQAKTLGLIEACTRRELKLDAVLTIHNYGIRIHRKNDGELLLCAPIHMVASVGFVKEDMFNILPIKIGEVDGNKDHFDLAVVYCKTSDIAEMICHLLGQCFHLVYREAVSSIDHNRVETDGLSLKSLNASSASPRVDRPLF